jgi:hypothetical protein
MGTSRTYVTWRPAPAGKPLMEYYSGQALKPTTLRDTAYVPGFGWAVIRFIADNPGVWLLHWCGRASGRAGERASERARGWGWAWAWAWCWCWGGGARTTHLARVRLRARGGRQGAPSPPHAGAAACHTRTPPGLHAGSSPDTLAPWHCTIAPLDSTQHSPPGLPPTPPPTPSHIDFHLGLGMGLMIKEVPHANGTAPLRR